MQKCTNILIRIIALLLCILITLVVVDFNNFRRRKVVQIIAKRNEACPVLDSRKTAEGYIEEENPKQLYNIFKTIKLLLFYELELMYADQYKSKQQMTNEHNRQVRRKINKKYMRLFRLIRDLQFEFTRRRFKYLTQSLNLFLKNIIVKKMDENEGEALLSVQKEMIHELGSTFIKVLFHRHDYTEHDAVLYIKTRQTLREIYRIMSSFHRKPTNIYPSVRLPQPHCNIVAKSNRRDSRSKHDYSKSDLNHTRLTGRILNALATKMPSTQSPTVLRHIRDTKNQTPTVQCPLNISRTWRTIDFFATDREGSSHLEELYPDYFLSKRPITSMDQIPTMPEDVILNLQENPDRHGYTRKGVMKKWRDNLNMTDEEMNYAIQTFRGNKTDSDLERDYHEQMNIFLSSFEAALRKSNLNLTVLEPTKKTQKKKVRTGTPPASRAANATRRFFNGTRPANFTRWTKKKNSTPLVRTKFIKVKKNKTTKEVNIRVRRELTSKPVRQTSRERLTRKLRKPSTKFVYGKKFNKLLPERYNNPDVLTISSEEKKIRKSGRRRSTAWNFMSYRLRTTGVYREPDTEEIAHQWRHRFVVRRQYDSVTYYDWNNFVGNETNKDRFENMTDNYGSCLETTTMSESDYMKTHSLPPDFWPEPIDFNEQKFHELMYESFYDMAGYTTAPIWFNSTKKTKHPRKLLKSTSPTHKPRTAPTHSSQTTINFVKLLVKQKLKEYASSKLRTTVTRGTFPYYIFNQSYITKFNDLFHHFEYAKNGHDLVNKSNVEMEKNVDNMGQYLKDLGAHLNELEEAMKKDVKISLDPRDGVQRTTGFVRYAEKTALEFSEKFKMSTQVNFEQCTFSTPNSVEFYQRTYNPLIEDFVNFAQQMKNFEKEMSPDKAKAKFMDIINQGRNSRERFNSSELTNIIRENKQNPESQEDKTAKDELKIEEINDEEAQNVTKSKSGRTFSQTKICPDENQKSEKRKSGEELQEKVKVHSDKGNAQGGEKKGGKKKRYTDPAFAEDSIYRDDDSGDLRNNVRKQNLRLVAVSTTEMESIASEEVEKLRKEWVRPMEEWEGNVTHRKLNRYQCFDCGQNNSHYYRASNFTEYVEHYRVHHFDMYNRSKFTEDLAWKLGYPNPYKCEFCDFYEPFDNDVCYDHYEKDHPDENPHDVYAHVFKMRQFYLDLRKQWPHNNSVELKEHVADLFGTPRFAGGTTECTACKFHHPTPRDPVFYSQFYVIPTTEASEENYDELLGNRSDVLPSNETRVRVPKWFVRECDKYRGASMPSGELLKNLSRGIFNSRSGENDTSEFKSDYYPSCDYRSKTLETGEDMWGSSCEDRM